MNMIKTWLDEEPILTRIGPVAVALAGYLFVRGLIDSSTADLILAIVGGVAGVGTVTGARMSVMPMAKVSKLLADNHLMPPGSDGG